MSACTDRSAVSSTGALPAAISATCERACSPRAWSRTIVTISPPWPASCLAVSSPTPLLAPVMTMTLSRAGCRGDGAWPPAFEGEVLIWNPFFSVAGDDAPNETGILLDSPVCPVPAAVSNRTPVPLRWGHAPPHPAQPRRPPPADPRRGPALLHPQRLPGHHDGRHLRRGRPVRRLRVLPLHPQGRDHPS